MKRLVVPFFACLLAVPVGAHPHIFIDTGFDLYFDDKGALTEIKVTWSYDAFYSLLITQDMGLDLDGDGLLTDVELTMLQGFDMNWSEGYDGDLVASADGKPVPLSAPQDYSAAFVLGRITTVHTRVVQEPKLLLNALQLRPRDPTYYTAYDVTYPVTLHGIESCETTLQKPQETGALIALQKRLSGLPAEADPADIGISDAGDMLATLVNVSCGAS
jgi:ABC-type uncharacterized transport system substrate-binding protein